MIVWVQQMFPIPEALIEIGLPALMAGVNDDASIKRERGVRL